jgi:hypothetical protein
MCLNNTNKHMTFVSKQCTQHRCSNNTNRRTTFMSISYEPMKNKFRKTIIAKLWPMKFVMQSLIFAQSFHLNLSNFLIETCELQTSFVFNVTWVFGCNNVVVKLYYEEIPDDKSKSTSRLYALMDKEMD